MFTTGVGYHSRADAATNPPFSSVLFIENNQGTDGSTTFSDATGNRILTPIGNAQIDTAQFILGNSSALFDGNGDGVSLSTNIALPSTITWSIEVWFRTRLGSYTGGTASLRGLTLRANSGGQDALEEIFYYDTDLNNRRPFGNLGGNKDVLFRYETNLLANTWYYFRAINNTQTSTFKAYLGTTPGTPLIEIYSTINKRLVFGTYGYSVAAATDYMDGHVGPIRVSRNFVLPLVVPSALFPET